MIIVVYKHVDSNFVPVIILRSSTSIHSVFNSDFVT